MNSSKKIEEFMNSSKVRSPQEPFGALTSQYLDDFRRKKQLICYRHVDSVGRLEERKKIDPICGEGNRQFKAACPHSFSNSSSDSRFVSPPTDSVSPLSSAPSPSSSPPPSSSLEFSFSVMNLLKSYLHFLDFFLI
jgi:hypothetical protein